MIRNSMVVGLLLLSTSGAVGTTPVQVTYDDTYMNYQPSLIQRPDGSRMIVYERLDQGLIGDLLVTFSDDGVSWTEPQLIIGHAANERHPALVQLPDLSYLVYYLSDSTGSFKIHHASSVDGVNWQELGVVDLGWTDERVVNPTVCLESDGSLTMTYDRLYVGGYIAHSEDGLVWDHDLTMVSNGPLNRIMRHSDGTYLLSYQRQTGSQSSQIDIFTKTSPDRVSWSEENRVTFTQNSHDSFPLELTGGQYGLYYATSLGGQPYDLYRRTSPDGSSWVNEENILPYAGWDTQPHPIVLDNGDIGMAWPRGITQTTTQVYYVELPPTSEVPVEIPTGGDASLRAWPNPSPGQTHLAFSTSSGGATSMIRIFDLSGHLVRAIRPSSSSETVLWDGTDEARRPVARGVYFVRLSAGRDELTRRIVLVD